MNSKIMSFGKSSILCLALIVVLPQIGATSSNRLNPDADKIIKERVLSMNTAISTRYNADVKKFIHFYLYKNRKMSSELLGKLPMYLPIFKEIAKQKGVPEELVYLPIIESALLPHAVSHMGATGLWQFMAPTGRVMGLHNNGFADERKDPVKSTEAALEYLKILHEMYGDWSLSLAAYNCGAGNLNKAIRRSPKKVRNFWDVQAYLPKETQEYLPRLIAASYLAKHYQDHGIEPTEVQADYLSTSVTKVSGRVSLKKVALAMNLKYGFLKALNPSYNGDFIPDSKEDNYLIIPYDKLDIFLQEFGSMDDIVMAGEPEYAVMSAEAATFVVVDSKSASATKVANLSSRQKSNNIPKDNGTDQYFKNATAINDRTYRYIKLASGSSLKDVAHSYGVNINIIIIENNISLKNLPQQGDIIRIPV